MYSKIKVDDILELHRGYDLPERERVDGDVPIISSSGYSGSHNQYKCSGENVVTGRYGTIGEVFYHVGNCWPLNTALYVSDYKGNYPRYIYYLLKYLLKLSIDGKDKSTVPGVDRNVIHQMMVPYCKEKEKQKKQISILEAIDKRIEINSKLNDNLRQMAMTIYDYWFTQFDFPDANGKPYRQSKGAFIHNDQLRKAIPVGWSVDSIIDNPLSSVITPGVDTFDIKEYLATANVNGTDILTGPLVDYDNREGRANMQPAVNSIWFAKMKNSIKHLFLNKGMQPLIDQAILSTGFCGLQCSVNSFEYIASFISTPYFEVAKDTLAHGATQEAVNNDDMKSINLLIPPVDVLKNYHEAVQPIYSEISRNICENRHLVELRDWLLPILMNGQAEVTN